MRNPGYAAMKAKRWRANNPDTVGVYRKSYGKRQALKQRVELYGITIEELARMRSEQNNLCAICGDPPKGKSDLHIDHCHKTGKVRQLLCPRCNMFLGVIEDTDFLSKADKYIRKHA